MADPIERIPGLGGFITRRKQIQDEDDADLRHTANLAALQSVVEKRQQARKLSDLLSTSGGDVEKAVELSLKSGNVGAAHQLAPLAKIAAERREREETRKGLAAILTPAAPEPTNPMAPGPGASVMAGSGEIVPQPAATTQRPIDAPQARIDRLNRMRLLYPDNASAQRMIETEIGKIEREMNKPPNRRDRFVGNVTIQEERRPDGTWEEYGRRTVADPNARRPTTINTNSGVLQWNETKRTWEPVTGPDGRTVRPQPTGTGIERNLSKDFEGHPVVKGYLEIQPDVSVVNSYMSRRASIPEAERAVYDKNLVNTFMRVTHPKGDQISNFERKDLAGLPALGPRIETAITGFFSGRHLPDDVATEMSKVINEKFKAREAQVFDLENKLVEDVKRHGGSPDAIRRITRGKGGAAPNVPPPPPGFRLD